MRIMIDASTSNATSIARRNLRIAYGRAAGVAPPG
jgi:hypothetical protein